MLEVSGINVFYGDFHVLHDVSLSVGRGEMVGVVGPNGHGKSTLLKAVCGLLAPKNGSIRFEGQEIAWERAPDLVGRGLVYVAEDRRLFPDMTVMENLQLGAYLARGRKNERRNLEHVFSLYPRLKERQNQLCRTLSGGEAQMVALARGLMSEPEFLAIDEPSLGLAPNLTEMMLKTIKQLNDDGLSILIVEQSLSLIEPFIDRTFSIEEGIVREATDAPVADMAT